MIIIIGYFTENEELRNQLAELRRKYIGLERRNKKIIRYTEMIFQKINCLQENNEFLINVNADFGKENDELREKVNEL